MMDGRDNNNNGVSGSSAMQTNLDRRIPFYCNGKGFQFDLVEDLIPLSPLSFSLSL